MPFDINAQEDMSFLRKGLVDMLTSRLYVDEEVMVLSREETQKALELVPEPIDDDKAIEIGNLLGVDYVLFGSLTVFGESVSIDAKMMEISTHKPIEYFNQTQALSDLIPSIDKFSRRINETVFGRGAQPTTPVRTERKEEETFDIHAHPEKVFEQELGRTAAVEPPEVETPVSEPVYVEKPHSVESTAADVPNPTFIPVDQNKSTKGFVRIKNIQDRLIGVSLGDVDKDGNIETVAITEHELYVFRYERERFYKVGEVKHDYRNNHIGVDIVDVNGNGYPEIFVTSLNDDRTDVRSFILEYNGKEYVEIDTNLSWYFRVNEFPNRGKILLGQKQQQVNPSPFAAEIAEMNFSSAMYVPYKQALPPGEANVMGFAMGDIMNDGQFIGVAYTESDYLRVVDSAGKEIWRGSEYYGGTNLYFVTSTDPREGYNERQYYPMRLIVRDINADGRYEVILAKNTDTARRLLKQFRKFSGGVIAALSWDGIGGMTEDWTTPKISGQITDFAIGDMDNDGKDELAVSVIVQYGSFMGKEALSSIIVYDLDN